MTATLDIIPDKAQYRPGEKVRLHLAATGSAETCPYRFTVQSLDTVVAQGSGHLRRAEAGLADVIELEAGEEGAFGVFVEANPVNGETVSAETAFDVAAHWREAPRYGFLSDFSPDGDDDDADVSFLNRYHINVVQFYDWMYRHDELVPGDDRDEFTDPMGRRLSLSRVRRKIEQLREWGMAAMAYAAVYAALRDYVEAHPDQGLYTVDGKPYSLIDRFYIMDISPDSAWLPHITAAFQKVLDFGFDGFHLDQYGFPKKAVRRVRGRREVVALKHLYPAFIDHLRETLRPGGDAYGLIFNNVGTYPVHTTARSAQDVVYEEVWDPVSSLRDVKHIIDRARELSGKQVVLAAYLPAFRANRNIPAEQAEAGAMLTMATIFASGGYHLLLGEDRKVLTTAYYPDYGNITERFARRLRHYYDFIVMYRDLLYDHALEDVSMTFTGGVNTEIVFEKNGYLFSPTGDKGTIWTIVKEKPGWLVIHLINLTAADNDIWHEEKRRLPDPVTDISVQAEVLEEIESVFWMSPDEASIRPERLDWAWVDKDEQFPGKYLHVRLPRLHVWSTLCVRTQAGVAAKVSRG